jgi:hypothetical protein
VASLDQLRHDPSDGDPGSGIPRHLQADVDPAHFGRVQLHRHPLLPLDHGPMDPQAELLGQGRVRCREGRLAGAGYHTACVGGTGFFNRRSELGSVLPDLFAESHWEESFGVTDQRSFENQVARAEEITATVPADQPLFLLLNVAALHQPNWFHLPGAAEEHGDTRASHAAALEYVDRHLPPLLAAMSARRPCFAIVCSDHGTAYGEDGYTGHRLGHETVWTVPYTHAVLPHGYAAKEIE